MNHSVHEKFPITDSYKAVQQAFMVLMMAAGIDGETNSVVEEMKSMAYRIAVVDDEENDTDRYRRCVYHKKISGRRL